MTTQKEKNILKELKRRLIEAGPSTSQDIRREAIDALNLIPTLAAYLVTAVLTGLFAFKIIAAGGLAAVMANLMASACMNSVSVPCEFNSLLAGMALALTVTTSLFYIIANETKRLDQIEFTDLNNGMDQPEYSSIEKNKVFKYLVALGGIDDIRNLSGLGAWIGVSYSTMYRYVKEFEKDGHIVITKNGSGIPMEIRIK